MSTATQPAFTFDAVRHLYRTREGIVVPSVTQCLKATGFINFDHIPPEVLQRKAALGSLVHQAAALWDSGEDLNDYELPEEVLPYLEGYFNFRNDCHFEPKIIEEASVAQIFGMAVGMTPDRIGDLQGEDAVLELKCGATEHPAWGLQCALYDLGSPRKDKKDKKHRSRQALQLGPQFPRNYKLRPYPEETDYRIAAGALAHTHWMLNKKILVFEDVPERLEI